MTSLRRFVIKSLASLSGAAICFVVAGPLWIQIAIETSTGGIRPPKLKGSTE
jgi:hypothetical protein